MKTNLVRRVVLAIALAALVMATFALVVSAGGGPRLWVAQEAPLYWTASTVFPVKGEVLTVGDRVEYTSLSSDWVQIDGSGYWVQGLYLTQVEPEGSVYEVLAAKKMSEITASEYYSLSLYLAGISTAPAPETAVTALPAAVPATRATTYTVAKGDSLSLIAARYGLQWMDLAKTNSIVSPYTIEVGQTLVIPSTTGVVATATSSASSPTTGWPTTAEAFLALATRGQPTPPADKSWIPIQLGEIHRPVGEANAWAVTREKDQRGNIVPFWVSNFSGRAQDGYALQGGRYQTGVPAGFRGLAQGVTFRP